LQPRGRPDIGLDQLRQLAGLFPEINGGPYFHGGLGRIEASVRPGQRKGVVAQPGARNRLRGDRHRLERDHVGSRVQEGAGNIHRQIVETIARIAPARGIAHPVIDQRLKIEASPVTVDVDPQRRNALGAEEQSHPQLEIGGRRRLRRQKKLEGVRLGPRAFNRLKRFPIGRRVAGPDDVGAIPGIRTPVGKFLRTGVEVSDLPHQFRGASHRRNGHGEGERAADCGRFHRRIE